MRPTTVASARAFRPAEPIRLPSRHETRLPRRDGHRPGCRQQVRFVVATTASI